MTGDNDKGIEPRSFAFGVGTALLRAGRQIWTRTPEMLKPSLAVLYIALCSVLISYMAIGIYFAFGDHRQVNWTFLGWCTVAGLSSALSYGVARRLLRVRPIARPWILSLIASAVFWGMTTILASVHNGRSPIRNPSDFGAFVIVVLIFGVLGGYLSRSGVSNHADPA